jgi:hypothetical protein
LMHGQYKLNVRTFLYRLAHVHPMGCVRAFIRLFWVNGAMHYLGHFFGGLFGLGLLHKQGPRRAQPAFAALRSRARVSFLFRGAFTIGYRPGSAARPPKNTDPALARAPRAHGLFFGLGGPSLLARQRSAPPRKPRARPSRAPHAHGVHAPTAGAAVTPQRPLIKSVT